MLVRKVLRFSTWTLEIDHLNCILVLFINHCMTLRELLNLLNPHFFTFSQWLTVNGIPLQYSCLENPKDGGAWWAVVHGVAKNRTRLSDFTFTFHFHELEKEMAAHSSALAWRIPGMGRAWWGAIYGVAQSRT